MPAVNVNSSGALTPIDGCANTFAHVVMNGNYDGWTWTSSVQVHQWRTAPASDATKALGGNVQVYRPSDGYWFPKTQYWEWVLKGNWSHMGTGAYDYTSGVGTFGTTGIGWGTVAMLRYVCWQIFDAAGNSNTPGYLDIPLTFPATTPTCTGPSVSEIKDKSVKVSFGCSNNGGANLVDCYIDVATDNFSTVVKTLAAWSGTISGLDPGRQYYVRCNTSNGQQRGYTGVVGFKTTFIKPDKPSSPVITYNTPEPIYNSQYTINWTASPGNGSTPVAGYRIQILKNNTQVASIDTETTNTSYNFVGTAYSFKENDIIQVRVYAYSKSYDGTKYLSGTVYSGTKKVVAPRYAWVSLNGGQFIKRKVYMSLDGGDFYEVKKGFGTL